MSRILPVSRIPTENAMKPLKLSKRFLLGCMYIFLVTGAMVVMTSSVLTYLMQYYHLSYEQGGLLLSIQAGGCLLSTFLSGALAIRIGRKSTLLLAAGCFLLGYTGLTLLPPLLLLQVLLFIAGLGWGAFNNLVNYLLALAIQGDSGKLILVHSSYSIGAFLAPFLVGLSVGLGLSWRIPTGLIAVLSLVLIVVIMAMPIQESSPGAGENNKFSLAFLRKWRFYLYMLLLFAYVGTEMGIIGWLVTYLTELRQYRIPDAQYLLSVLMVSMIAGRIAVSFLSSRFRKSLFLMIEGISIFLCVLLLINASLPPLITIAVILVGLSFSAFYAMVLVNASNLIVESSLVSGLIMSLGGLGATVTPLLVGIFAEKGGIMAGLRFLVVLAGLLLALTIINFIAHRQQKI
jgi:FHS family glucose/mannose:H+ symporter-like MFS transporter